MKSFQGIVFDLDGVLVDSEPFHKQTWLEALTQFGAELEMNWHEGFVGIPDTETAVGLVSKYSLPTHWENLVELKRDIMKQHASKHVRAFKGVKEGLLGLKGFPKAVATSSSREIAETFLNAAGLMDHFSVIITSNDVANTKPDPACYLEACRSLQLDPATCLALEDSPAGIESAKSAGLYALGISTSFEQSQLARADNIFPSMTDAFFWLKENII
ncbi:MAG: HAD family phosphatase [Bacteroidetes bacterium]|nr:HAD family phosphatase [Bacteroidota bacterium]